jgi:hypothetical protein
MHGEDYRRDAASNANVIQATPTEAANCARVADCFGRLALDMYWRTLAFADVEPALAV